MVDDNYVRIIYNSDGSSQEGRKIKVNIEPIERSKGIPTSDIPIPTLSEDNRILIPTGGLQDDFTLNIVFHEETDDVAFDVSSGGTETARSDVKTIQEQWDFLFNEVIQEGIFGIYELYIDWNDSTYRGWLTVQSSINNEEYTGRVEARLLFKVGKNPLAFLT
jgi:hypothetical protein